MTPDDSFEVPFDIDDETAATTEPHDVVESEQTVEITQPYIGEWNSLISTTNWEKGRIITEWRGALMESGAPSTQYSDEAWSQKVGGVTAPHVGRLRRVYDRFHSTFESYTGLYWSHFLAALDWDDAPLWLEGASQDKWSVSIMREKRWEAHGAVESQRPTASQVIEVDTDEDVVMPAQGGGSTREYGDDPSGVSAGPVYEGPDFGDQEPLAGSGQAPTEKGNAAAASDVEPAGDTNPIQPFVGLPDLPDDVSDALEAFKLALLRHKTAGWRDITAEDIQRYLDAIGVMIRA